MIIASTTTVVPADHSVRLSFEEKIYGNVFLGSFEFDAADGATYDVVGGDELPANPASYVDKIARTWAPYAGAKEPLRSMILQRLLRFLTLFSFGFY